MKNKFIASSILVTLIALAAAVISLAQSASQSPGGAPNPSLSLAEFNSRLRSGTLASNLSDVETGALINNSLKTDAAVQLWARMHFSSDDGVHAANVAQVLGVLASLREGRTNDAIRKLEFMLDSDLWMMGTDLSMGQSEPVLKLEPRARDLLVLREAREYRLKYPHQSEATNMEAGVQRAFSLLETK
jgi:hypothetical protein